MTAALTAILALALWLLLAPSGGPDRRLRKVLSVPSGTHLPEVVAARLRRWRGRFPRRGSGAAASEVPMTVLVQQLAALLKGGRTPARAAAVRGLPVAAAIRARASPEHGRSAPRSSDRGEQAVWMDLAACFDVAEASGCPLADVLTRFAAHLESEGDARAARETALAGPKATVRILTWLPFLGLGLGLLLGVDPWTILLGSPWGVAALIAGLALTASGRIWSARLVRGAAGRPP